MNQSAAFLGNKPDPLEERKGDPLAQSWAPKQPVSNGWGAAAVSWGSSNNSWGQAANFNNSQAPISNSVAPQN